MNKYRVIVLREGEGADETLFEVAGSASLVQNIVPGVLDTVLAGSEVAPAPERSLADRVFDSAVAAGAAAEQQAEPPAGETEEQKTKRTRRTKAQVAADKEAQAAGFRDAAHRAEVEEAQRQANTQQVAAVPAEAPAAPYMTPDGPVVPEQAPPAAAAAPPATPPAPPTGAGTAAAPGWNPFVQ